MFWSGNYIAVRELNFLLKEENVSLTQVLEADDILQECKADNKALMQFLTKPEILAELITLITEEPPKNVEVASQYRHANIACEVLTSHLSMLSDRLSSDTLQMNRLCDFINKDPPLNPLLASYFSKTIEMLLERSPKQDWYLYHIVCLRVLDFFKSRRDFLPNLLRHISTSAIADTFKYFIRLDDLFNKIIMEWLEEHQFLESLIQIICGTYVSEELSPPPATQEAQPLQKASDDVKRDVVNHKDSSEQDREEVDKGLDEAHVQEQDSNNTDQKESSSAAEENVQAARALRLARARARRVAGVASANAAALLCDLVVDGCAPDGCSTRPRTSWVLVSRLQSERMVRSLLQGMFTSPLPARRHAIVNGCQLLSALLSQEPILAGESEAERTSVELAVAPHLPLLHHALLHDPELYVYDGVAHEDVEKGKAGDGGRVGLARVQVAALLAHLALSEVEEVPTTMLTLGTPGVLVEMFFKYPNNNFLHAEVYALVKHALMNRAYRTQYARHLLVECDLLTRLMDVFEENENKTGSPRSAYMGHVVLALSKISRALEPSEGELPDQIPLSPELMQRFQKFKEEKLKPLLQQHDTPLGGSHPADAVADMMIAANYDYNHMGATATMDDLPDDQIGEMCEGGASADSADFIADGLGLEEPDEKSFQAAKNHFLEMVSDRLGDDMWDDTPEVDLGEIECTSLSRVNEVLGEPSPWDASASFEVMNSAGEGWAHFGSECPAPADPFAPASPTSPAGAGHGHRGGDPPPVGGDPFSDDAPASNEFTPYWGYNQTANSGDPSAHTELEESLRNLRLEDNLADKSIDEASSVELANNLLSAMSGMTADAIANIVNANMPPAMPPTMTANIAPELMNAEADSRNGGAAPESAETAAQR